MHAPRQLVVRLAATLATGSLLACGAGVPQTIERPPLTEQNRQLYARINLQKARALEAEGRFEMSASAAQRGLEFEPDNPELHRIRARSLAALGRDEQAETHRRRADELAPPPPPLETAPHPLAGSGADVLMVLLPPDPALLGSAGARGRLPEDWPHGAEADVLVDRLRARLPGAAREVVATADHPTSKSVPAARDWLDEPGTPDALVSLRVERAFCGSTIKDGRFAVAWLRVGVARPESDEGDTHLIRVVLDDPQLDDPQKDDPQKDDPQKDGCAAAALAVALERSLELDSVRRALTASAAGEGASWSSAALRQAFPGLEARLQAEIQQGRRFFSLGELALALSHFAEARRIDPDDPVANGFLDDTERSIDLARRLEPLRQAEAERLAQAARDRVELPAGATPLPKPPAAVETDDHAGTAPVASGVPDPDHLAAQLSPAQRTNLEAQLAHEERRRAEMLSALAVLYEMRNAPSVGTVANMRPGEVGDPTATGVSLALPRVKGGAVEVRTLYAPDGSVLARYYFGEDSENPVLREDDTDGDGTPDRWVGYERGIISEVWESETPGAPPSVHLVYGLGGAPIERVEVDHDGDGRLDRLFVYASGQLREESWDTDGDGAFDRFQTFDESGSLTLREEDVDGDEEIDVRTAYRGGRIIRREILNAELLSEIQ